MKTLIIGILGLALVLAVPMVKRQVTEPETYELPDAAEKLIGTIKHTFKCAGRQFGYYADQDNNCQIFHVCSPVQISETETATYRHSFFCSNQTVFDQEKLVCTFPEDAVDCAEADKFYSVNDNFGVVPGAPVTDLPPPKPADGESSAI